MLKIGIEWIKTFKREMFHYIFLLGFLSSLDKTSKYSEVLMQLLILESSVFIEEVVLQHVRKVQRSPATTLLIPFNETASYNFHVIQVF